MFGSKKQKYSDEKKLFVYSVKVFQEDLDVDSNQRWKQTYASS